ncbi:MAG TPA: hypothetical protein DCR46_02805 [Cytophagales bacterium]|nr:hypothetical protein [Cytophagales bacterium]
MLVSSALGTASYRAKVTNILGSCFGNSPVQTITVLQNIANNTIGKGDTICQGNNAKTIGNSPAQNSYGYAWLSSITSNNSDFSPIIGISTQTLSVSPTQTTHYKRIALNNCKNDTSAAYTVLVDPTLTLGAISVSDSSLCAGNTSTIGTLTPTGGTPSSFKYEWQFSSNGTTWSPSISGATSSTYTPQSLTSSTYYRGIVNSLKCTATSNPLLLKVTQPIVSSSNTISASQIICAGSTPASLTGTVVTGGIQPTTYLWLQSTDNSSWTDAIGTNNVINYAPSALNTTTYFKRVITSTGPCKKDTSSSLTINIDNAVVAGKISASLTSVCSGTSPILNNDISASGGTDPLAYSWQYSFDGMDWFDINSNTASLNNAPSITSATKFRRIATSSASTCSGTTEAVTVNVDGFAKPGSISALITSFCSGQTPGPIISNTPASNGSITPPSYQWQYLNESIWIDLVGETSDTYSPGPLTSNISFRRRAVFGNATCDTAFTSAVEFSIYPKLNPGAIESGISTVCEGGDFTVKSVSLPSGGSPNKLFTWNISNEPYTIWRDTLVETANSDLSIFNIQQNTRVRRITIDDCGNDTSNVFEIRVKTKADPVIRFTAPVPDNLCASNNLTLKVDTLDAGVNPQIIWVYNNVPYTNLGTSFNVPKPLIDGAIVKVFLVVNPNVKCTYAGDSTFDYKLSVKQPISNNIISGDQSKCAGSLFDKITGTKALGNTAVNPYTWQSSNDKFNWTTTNTTEDYDPGSFTNPGDYYFRRIVASSGICGNDTSNLVKISVQPIVYNGKISALDVTRCAGDTLVIENINDPLGGNGSFTFSWVVSTDASNPNSWSPILNEYTKELRIAKDKLDPTKSTFFFRRNIISGICSNFDTTSVIVCQKPIIGSNPKLSPICSNRGSLDKDTADSLNFVVIKTNNPRQPDDDYSPSGEPLVVSPLDPLAFSPKNGKSSILFSAGIATFTYKPNPNFVGNDTVGFNLCSSTNPTSCNTKYFYINVMRRNYKPTAKGEAYSVYRNQEVSGNIFLNDSDLENDTLYAYPSEMSIPSNAKYMLPKFGNITMSSNGDFTYVPNKDIGKGGEIKDTAIFFVTEFSKRPSKYCNSLFNYLDTIIITIKPYRIFVPEGFSPNGDGVNDNFVIASEVPLKMELSIYNRWGNLVYENNDYKNDWNGIPNKGLIVGGDGVPDGTYYIRYNINNGEQEDFRYITISR